MADPPALVGAFHAMVMVVRVDNSRVGAVGYPGKSKQTNYATEDLAETPIALAA